MPYRIALTLLWLVNTFSTFVLVYPKGVVLILSSSRKYSYFPHRISMYIQRGRGWHKYEAKGWGMETKIPSIGGVSIFSGITPYK